MEDKIYAISTLEKEIQNTENYLKFLNSDSKDNFSWSCKVDPKVELSTLIPDSILKCFVENSVINNVSRHPGGGNIDISIHCTTLGILIMITDNGALRYEEYNRRRLIGKRLEKLDNDIEEFNKIRKHSISYQLLDLDYAEPGQTGTRVLITIVQ